MASLDSIRMCLTHACRVFSQVHGLGDIIDQDDGTGSVYRCLKGGWILLTLGLGLAFDRGVWRVSATPVGRLLGFAKSASPGC
jgi:hypothetical protein